jgi:hypothetical protein
MTKQERDYWLRLNQEIRRSLRDAFRRGAAYPGRDATAEAMRLYPDARPDELGLTETPNESRAA